MGLTSLDMSHTVFTLETSVQDLAIIHVTATHKQLIHISLSIENFHSKMGHTFFKMWSYELDT